MANDITTISENVWQQATVNGAPVTGRIAGVMVEQGNQVQVYIGIAAPAEGITGETINNGERHNYPLQAGEFLWLKPNTANASIRVTEG